MKSQASRPGGIWRLLRQDISRESASALCERIRGVLWHWYLRFSLVSVIHNGLFCVTSHKFLKYVQLAVFCSAGLTAFEPKKWVRGKRKTLTPEPPRVTGVGPESLRFCPFQVDIVERGSFSPSFFPFF